MNRRILVLVWLPLLLSGCTSVVIPDDAVVDTYDGIPDATLHGWVEPEGNFTRIVAHFEYEGHQLLTIDSRDPRGHWNLTILTPDGEEVLYDERPSRRQNYETEIGPYEETFYFTWLHDEKERYEQPGIDESIPSHPVPSGEYTAIVQFLLAYEPDDAFEVRMPVVVA